MKYRLLIGLTALLAAQAEEFTRGVGIYPGDPAEDFGPALRIDEATPRNLALNRLAYHSSAYDYNLTAQLVTDGIVDPRQPLWFAVSTSQQGVLKKHQQEWLFDGNWVTDVGLEESKAWIQVEFGGDLAAAAFDRVDLDGSVRGPQPENQVWNVTLSSSDDGKNWKVIGTVDGVARPSGEMRPSLSLKSPQQSRFYRFEFETGRAARWRVGEVAFFLKNARVKLGGPHRFTSAWMAATEAEPWVYVDLGAICSFDRVKLSWIQRPSQAVLESSDDAESWHDLKTLAENKINIDDLKLAPAAKARFVRVRFRQPGPGRIVLSELEVYGKGGPVPEPKPRPEPKPNERIALVGGAWKIQRDSLVKVAGEVLSRPSFKDAGWLVATVPGTVLTSYYNAGALPDPNFGANQEMISDSFFYADFWYRTEFPTPTLAPGQRLWLNFDGVNWKAEVFLNARKVGRIEGGFVRGQFDITPLLRSKQSNILVVRVEKNATPGSVKEKTFDSPDKNGGVLGLDNPTYHASAGWDWIPTIRGRNTGLWGPVFLDVTGPVTVRNPLVSTKLAPDQASAEVAIQVSLRNHTARPVQGTLRGRFGDVSFQVPVSLPANAEKAVKLDSAVEKGLHLEKPRLWWPAGYGEPELYPVDLRFETPDKKVSDSRSFLTGIRQFTYTESGDTLKIWINGRRFIPRGGNWGFSESMLRYRAREYDAAVRYHADMHFNIIRNWVGQIGDEAFYEACDRHGIVVWQDFWLANPWDGPDPADHAMFLSNVNDTILRIRNHPSIGLYCGRNEGYPPKPIDDGIRETLSRLHPEIRYIPSSADEVVSGHGPYRAMTPKQYFEQRATTKFHSEMGMPNIPSMESLQQMMPESGIWPQDRLWGLHDFSLNGAQGGKSFLDRIRQSYGGAANGADWVWLAQFVNYEGYRAMFEAQSRNRMGLLIWMSHPAWPSLVWQTYDYYLEPTAAYFGSKKGSEPLHIQWNPATDQVEVVNYNAGNSNGLMASVEVLNLDGVVKWQQTHAAESAEDSTVNVMRIEYPDDLTPVHFIRLKLTRGEQILSENFYWRGLEDGNFQAVRTLPRVELQAATRSERTGDDWILHTVLTNPSRTPALMVRVKAVRESSGDRILPALYSDNYIALMPGEKRTIRTQLKHADTRGEWPRIVVDGFNATQARPPAVPRVGQK